MRFRHTVSVCALLCFLFIAIIGCRRSGGSGGVSLPGGGSGGVSLPGGGSDGASPPQPTPDQLHKELVREYNAFQKKTENMMEEAQKVDKKVSDQWKKLVESLNGMPSDRAIDLFQNARANGNRGIPPDLNIAYDYWLALLPDEVHLERIIEEIETRRASRFLPDMESDIKEFENNRQFAELMSESDRRRIDELLARVKGFSTQIDVTKVALYEESVIKKQKVRPTNRE